MRCFIAIELPEDVKIEMRRVQDQLKSYKLLNASFTKDFHLTLKFLGETSPIKVEHVRRGLSQCKFRKFSIGLDNIGVFPNENFVRVIWVGLKPARDVIKLQQQIDEALQKEYPKEKDFKAHVTLARVKYFAEKEKFLHLLRSMNVEGRMFEVSRFKLIRSTLASNGPVYEELGIYNCN